MSVPPKTDEWLNRQLAYYSKVDNSLRYKNNLWQNYIIDNFLEFAGHPLG